MKKSKNKSKIRKEEDRKYVTILGVKINSTPKGQLLDEISKKIANKHKFYIVTPNPEIVVEAQKNLELFRSLSLADISLPDGIGITLAVKFLEGINLRVVKGRDFMLDLLEIAEKKHLKVYLLGAPRSLDKSLLKMKKEFPNAKIEGNPGPILDNKANVVPEVNSLRHIDTVEEINKFVPDILFVAFGAPKQEIWIAKNISKLKVSCVMTVGGSLDYYAELTRPVPKWMEKLSIEWLWRLIQEPKRIKRIINAVIIFPFLVFRTKMIP